LAAPPPRTAHLGNEDKAPEGIGGFLFERPCRVLTIFNRKESR
jgi:hypothetical protein